MTAVFEGEVLHVLPLEKGIIITYVNSRSETQIVSAFKMISFDTGKVTNIAKNIYQLSKFGGNYRAFAKSLNNYFSCKTIILPSEKLLVLELDGSLKLLDTDASLIWEGKLLYKNVPPSSAAIYGNKLWACFPEHNVLIRYNINTMREELRIGGGANSPFIQPKDIFIKDNFGYISNYGSFQILKLNLDDYSLEVYKEFEDSVKQYLEVGTYRFVVTNNGVFLID